MKIRMKNNQWMMMMNRWWRNRKWRSEMIIIMWNSNEIMKWK